MYAQHTNNPFLNANQDDASTRYPDINNMGSPPPSMGGWQPQQQQQQQYGQPNPGYNPGGFMQQEQQPQPQPGYVQSQPSFGYGMGQGMPQATPYSPTQQYPGQQSQFSSVQYQPQYSMSPVGSTPTGLPYQAQQPSNYNAVADLDPYSNLSNASFAGSQPQSQPQSQYSPSGSQPQTQHGDHPRAFVQKFKSELEQWDTVAWKQVMLRIADLRSAWEVRKRDLGGALEGARFNGWTQGEMQQCQTMIKEAGDNVDTCHASEFQLKEVQSGYRHSTDPASKNRVRDALNAGFRSLPDYPPPL